MTESEDELLSISEAATELGYSRRFIYMLIDRGDLKPWRDPTKKRGGVRIPRSQVDAIIRKRGFN